MSGFIEIVAGVAALLADLLLGNYGCTPYLTIFVIFHASECVSVRFAAVLALLAGMAFDLVYCRSGMATALLMTAALFAGRTVFSATAGADRDRSFVSVLLPGAAMGVVMSLGEIMVSRGGGSWPDALCAVLSGALSGLLECVAVLAILDAVSGFLGLRGVLRPVPGQTERRLPRRRTHRVRATNVMRRRR